MIVDIIVLVGTLTNIIRGMRKGLILEVVSSFGLFVSIYIASKKWQLLRPFWEFIPSPLAIKILSFITILVGTYLLFFILGLFMKTFVKRMSLGGFDTILGGLIGFLEVWILLSLLVHWSNTRGYFIEFLRKSKFFPYLVYTGEMIHKYIPKG